MIVQSLGALKEYKSLYFLWHRYDGWGASSLQMGWLNGLERELGPWNELWGWQEQLIFFPILPAVSRKQALFTF